MQIQLKNLATGTVETFRAKPEKVEMVVEIPSGLYEPASPLTSAEYSSHLRRDIGRDVRTEDNRRR